MKKPTLSIFLVVVFLAVLTNGCVPASTPIPPTLTPSPIPPTSTPEPTATLAPSPTPIPRLGVITFDSDRDNGWPGIYAMKADGSSEAIPLAVSPFNDEFSAWSPDGQRVAFNSYRSGNYDIYLVNADSTGLTRLTDSPAEEIMPSWSPDGKQIVFLSSSTGGRGSYEIHLINMDGTDRRRLADNAWGLTSPSWSPDGRQIAFEREHEGGIGIFLINVEGGDLTQLTEEFDFMPAWSPDGERLAFMSLRDGNEEIYVMNIDGVTIDRLTNDPSTDLYPAWSPDGHYIAFSSDRKGNYDIFVMRADGSGVERLTTDPADDLAPSWSPPDVHMPSIDALWVGPPFCARDTDGDRRADTPTASFTTKDAVLYVVLPYRNMKDGTTITADWVSENGKLLAMGIDVLGGGDATFISSVDQNASWGVGQLTINFSLVDPVQGVQEVQEIKCNITKP